MSKDHREIVRQVDQLKYHVNDLIDDPHHPYGKDLLKAVELLGTDVKIKRPSINIEKRIEDIMRSLHQIRNHGDQVMDFGHTDMFIKQCVEINGNVREYYPY